MTYSLWLCLLWPAAVQAQTAIGRWRDCLDYSVVQHVQPAGRVFRYDTDDRTIHRMNKTTGLSDAGVATIAYDDQSRSLVVAYNNTNIDIVCDDQVFNLSDIKRSEISGDKGIYSIRFHSGKAYLATGFGVVVIDLARHEIKETWYLGTGGAYTTVYDLAFTADSLYAATAAGLKRIAVADPYPAISDRWTADHRLDSLSLTMLDVLDGHLLAAGYGYDVEKARLYVLETTGFREWNYREVKSMHAGGGYVTLAGESGVVRYNSALQRTDSLTTHAWGDLPSNDAVTTSDGSLWVGHNWNGLIHFPVSGTDETITPSGPYSGDNVFRLVPFNYRMMLCPGGHSAIYGNSGIPPNMLTTNGRSWHGLDFGDGLINSAYDLVDVAVNPNDTTEMMAALWGYGVVSIKNNRVSALYNADNTGGAFVPYTSGSYATLLTGALTYDADGNLWVLNALSPSALVRCSAKGQWTGFDTRLLGDQPALDKLIYDSINGYLWFCGRSNTIYVHDGKSRMAKVNPNYGSKLSTDNVTALVQDRTGNLWVGTNKGIKVIYDAYRAFNNGGVGEQAPVSCSNITITNGEFYEYLMAYESITSIAVDGANRKWVGTASGGLYLISANGLEQLQHFTAENSPLFSNKIITLGIQPRTGEVYIGTDRGLQVYRSTATYAESAPLDQVYAFPNPVRPGYDGPIAIKGFTRDAMVHITDAAGHTVFSTQAIGGQAVWNGRTLNGEPVAAGVYYVFAADTEGGNRSVTKILIVR